VWKTHYGTKRRPKRENDNAKKSHILRASSGSPGAVWANGKRDKDGFGEVTGGGSGKPESGIQKHRGEMRERKGLRTRKMRRHGKAKKTYQGVKEERGRSGTNNRASLGKNAQTGERVKGAPKNELWWGKLGGKVGQ